MKYFKNLMLVMASLILSSCATTPPRNVDNICSVFRQYPHWYRDSVDVQRRWWVPIYVQMAIIHQESHFNAHARPPRTKLLWIIPWTRPSTAYGYAQVLDGTWSVYRRANGGFFSGRHHFADGVDFIGWYANEAHKRAGISRQDPYNLYLAYHEGIGGFQRKTYLSKPWLIAVAHKVSSRSAIYQAQLKACRSLPRVKSWYTFG